VLTHTVIEILVNPLSVVHPLYEGGHESESLVFITLFASSETLCQPKGYSINRRTRGRTQVTTDLAGKFCHPDGHAKRFVETGKVINHLLRISSVNVRSHMVKLAKNELLRPCLTTGWYDTIRTVQ
jgi:hypothetical protein